MITKEQQMVADFYEKIGNAVKGHLVDIKDGPIVCNFIMKPGEYSNLATIKKAAKENDCVVSYDNGRINVQVPKETRQMIFLDKLLKTKEFKNTDAVLPIILGVDTFGEMNSSLDTYSRYSFSVLNTLKYFIYLYFISI